MRLIKLRLVKCNFILFMAVADAKGASCSTMQYLQHVAGFRSLVHITCIDLVNTDISEYLLIRVTIPSLTWPT